MTALQPAKVSVNGADMRPDRIESATIRQAVRPDLAPPKVVTAPPQTEPSRTYSREPPIDAQTRALITRAIEESSRPLMRPMPERALQRSRAYRRAARLDESRPRPRSDLNI
jgi:hypothetical protein